MHSVLIDFPDHFETQRLLIRSPLPGDGMEVNAAIRESEVSLKPWMPFANPVGTVEDTEENIRHAYAKFVVREDLRLHLYDKANGAFLGSSGLHRIDWETRRFEIGYWLRTSASGKGYMTEAVNGIVAFASEFLSAQRIEIRCDSRNIRSRSVAERASFHLEGILRNNRVALDGNLEHTCIFAKLRLADGTWGYPDFE